VCRMRDTPVIVFINKMDRDGKNRFDLLEEIEKELKISLHPMTWPINSGKEFKGVYNLHDKSLRLFTASTKADDEDVISISDLSDKTLDTKIGERDAEQLREDVELIDGVYGELNGDDYLSGKRGQYTEKYGAEQPWYSQADLRILQDLYTTPGKKRNTLQFSIDLINFGNLISSEWGVREYATTSGYFQPISVAYNGNSPTYQFDPSLTSTFQASPDLPSRWQMQLGLRYIF